LRLVYAGNMAAAYDLETVIGAVARLRRSGVAVTLDLAGGGEKAVRLRASASADVRFHGFLGGAALADLLRAADVGVVPMFPASRVAVPYKLADYAAAGLAVLTSLDGESLGLVETFQAGCGYRVGDTADFEAAVGRYAAEPALLAAHRAGARRLAEERFDAARIYPEFVRWLEQVRAVDGCTRNGRKNA